MAFVIILGEKLLLHECNDFQNPKIFEILYIRGHKFSTNLGVATKSRHQKGYMKHFHTRDPQILGATSQNLVARAIWHPGFVYLCAIDVRVLKPVICVQEDHGSKLAKDADYS